MLYDHIDDHDLKRISREFVDAVDVSEIVTCDLKHSRYYNQDVSILDCYDPENRVNSHHDNQQDPDLYEPWVFPNVDAVETEKVYYNKNNNTISVQLLAKNPGIWTIDGFLSPQESDTLMNMIYKNGHDKGMFGVCEDPRKHFTSKPRPNVFCFKISEDKICEGPWQISTCQHDTDPDHGTYIKMLRQRAEQLVSVQLPADYQAATGTASMRQEDALGALKKLRTDSYVLTIVSTGNTPPHMLHEDNDEVVSFLLYLTDGGARTVFPGPNVTITPKKGMVAMWLNVDRDGNELQSAHHAVEAHHGDRFGDRMVVKLSFTRATNLVESMLAEGRPLEAAQREEGVATAATRRRLFC
jgi:hypothetical protein